MALEMSTNSDSGNIFSTCPKGRVQEFAAGAAIATAELGGGRGRGGRGTVTTGGRGGRGNGRGGAGGRAGAAAPDSAAAQVPATKPDSVFWIYVPTNIDIAANLKGKLLLETGDEDNNVSPSNTIRLVNALIQNNKRFDYIIYPGQPHSYGPMAPYAFQLQAEYLCAWPRHRGSVWHSAAERPVWRAAEISAPRRSHRGARRSRT